MKTCHTCKHVRKGFINWLLTGSNSANWRCASPMNPVNPVDGLRVVRFCTTQRSGSGTTDGYCGRRGDFYEPKEI